MHSVVASSTALARRILFSITGAITVILATGCRDYLAPEPVEDIPDWVIEVGHKISSPEIIGPKVGSDSSKRAATDPNSSVISR